MITAPRRGGRPTRDAAARLEGKIIEVATGLFLRHGFGATSVEAVVAGAGVSKRTFYHRFADKAALFQAVVHRLIAQWLQHFAADRDVPAPIAVTLRRAAKQILAIALLPDALALHRLLVAESRRFPELAIIMSEEGATKGTGHLAELLAAAAREGEITVADTRFAAEQFLVMVLAVPQRRALGFGPPLDPEELDRWAERTVDLFLYGCGVPRG